MQLLIIAAEAAAQGETRPCCARARCTASRALGLRSRAPLKGTLRVPLRDL